MDIANLLNNDDDGADWEYESSDTEEADNASEAAPPVAATPPPQRRTGNEYVDRIIQASGLYIIRDKEVQAAYNARGELGFFSLFFTREFRASLQSWTNKTLKKKGIQEGT
ncbi:hypothetical protein PF002_g5257 [Phytophthora fragariae]|uniref:PiggyBac transposable element-derived protein domain-containing protein n=1 Tax=Phytophthora fragariae TaxID=53985 RepID=A0A6A4A3A9_9STRA|nr:hypothetical protein PF002_g5257 [Phytophthora fragariae]